MKKISSLKLHETRPFLLKNFKYVLPYRTKPSSKGREINSMNTERSLNYVWLDEENNWEEKFQFILILHLSDLLCFTKSRKVKVSMTNEVGLKYPSIL